MAVDEFGREIPQPAADALNQALSAPRSGSAEQLPRRHHSSHGRHHHHHHHHSHHTPHHHHSKRGSGGSDNQHGNHPSKLYQEEPLLCEFVWKDRNSTTANEAAESSSYEDYRKSYCLRFVRSYFNKHLDDSWFRARYSPLTRHRQALEERERAAKEATLIKQAMASQQEDFVANARLGGGIKSATATNTCPPSHVLTLGSAALHVTEIPYYVTDEQLVLALSPYMTSKQDSNTTSSSLQVYSTTPVFATTARQHDLYLSREAIVVCPSDEVCREIYMLLGANSGSAVGAVDPVGRSSIAVPRKQDGQEVLALEVDCSDPYGRLEYDADGKGGAPADGLPIPSRKATVHLRRYVNTTSCVVLSASLSSTRRIPSDKEAALTLARALDSNKHIPNDCRLDEILPTDLSDADSLDVAVAYLRRVHLFSFYNGCSLAPNLADVLCGKHAASTVHLRLENADELLEPSATAATDENDAEDSNNNNNNAKDLLVQRLDDSIQKSLDECTVWVGNAEHVIDKETDRAAREIQDAERAVHDVWLRDHLILDDDHRARCSFHFCHKLFKDSSFLQKHLMKKHGEFLVAEQAKCHDKYMMEEWDSRDERPVPEILVDCGANFGLVPTTVKGREPDCVDPEPDLWKLEEERREREREQRQQREEQRQQRAQQETTRTFVDVDDMKEEKVEVSFDNVAIPVKKKKKRKLL